MAQTKPKAGQFYGVSGNGTDGQFLKTDGTGGMSWDSPITNPTITSIDYPGSQTAANPAGGESVIINGTNFISGITCTIGGTSAVTAFNSATQITITTPAKAAGQYTVAVTNTNGGTASQANFIQYSGVPVWSTASGSLGSVQEGDSASFQVTATEGSDTIEYAVTTGSLPTGLSLNTNTGAITGTAPTVSASTTTTFSITATDDENQTSSARSFNITVTPDLPSNHFAPYIYTGNGGSQNIPLNFSPGLTWIKSRTNPYDHNLYDIVRGADGQGGGSDKVLSSNKTNAQEQGDGDVTITNSGVTVVETTGSSSSSEVNLNGANYISWNFKAGGAAVANDDGNVTSQVSANTTLGFSIVSFSNTNSATNTFGHGLGAQPELVIIKPTSISADWFVYVDSLGKSKRLKLNTADSESSWSSNDGWNTSTGITSSVLSFAYSGTSYPFIAYCFTSKPGFSKVGTYTGNTTNLPIVSIGFEPAFLMIKAVTTSDSWFMVDNKRETSNPRGDRLFANSSAAEASEPGAQVNFLTNGFQITGSGGGAGQTNSNGATYLYLAFAADPSTTTPSLANSFSTDLYTGNGGTQAVTGVGFKTDFSWVKHRDATGNNNNLADSIRGVNNVLYSNLTNAQYFNSTYQFNSFDTDGITVTDDTNGNYGVNGNNETYVTWNWKSGGLASINTDGTRNSVVSANAAAGFSIVKWTGDNNTATIGHGLNAAPELIIVKKTSAGSDWPVYSSGLTSAAYRLVLNSNAGQSTTNDEWNSTAPTSTVFSVGSGGNVSDNGQSFIGYCFTSIAGYSKVGTYTGSNSSGKYEATGFQPSYLMIKAINNTGYWVILDNKRVTGNNKWGLYADGNWGESNSYDVSFDANGFTLNTTDVSLNGSYEYLYLAIKEN